MLEADLVLGRRRARTLECGIDCLEDDIDGARTLARRRIDSWMTTST